MICLDYIHTDIVQTLFWVTERLLLFKLCSGSLNSYHTSPVQIKLIKNVCLSITIIIAYN